jgi:hypothetical protein
MSTESLFERKPEFQLPIPPYLVVRDGHSRPVTARPLSLAEALDNPRFKKALLTTSLAAAAVYYVSVITIAVAF